MKQYALDKQFGIVCCSMPIQGKVGAGSDIPGGSGGGGADTYLGVENGNLEMTTGLDCCRGLPKLSPP